MNPVDMSAGTEPAEILAGASWGLVSYSVPEAPQASRAGIIGADGAVHHLEAFATATSEDILARWDDFRDQFAELDVDSLPVVEGARLSQPIRPPKLVMAGANYHSHIREMGGEAPVGMQPFFFLKPATTAVVPDGAEIAIDPGPDCRMDWEAEVGVVIGRRVHRLAPEAALDCIAGYLVLNDITDRAKLARKQPVLGAPFAFDWLASKSLDGSCPISSAIVPAHLVPDPRDVRLRLWVNGDLKQDASTADMITDFRELLVELSAVMTLEPGDIVATGTPSGVGAGRGEFLKPGDVVSIQADGIGRLTNRIVDRGA